MHAKSLDRIFLSRTSLERPPASVQNPPRTRHEPVARYVWRCIRVRALRPAVDAVALWSSGASERGCGGGKKAGRRGEGKGGGG